MYNVNISLNKLKSLCDKYDRWRGMNREDEFEGECVYNFIVNQLTDEWNKERKKNLDMDLKDLW